MRVGVLACGLGLAACSHAPVHLGATGPQALTPITSTALLFYDDGPAYRDSVRIIVRDAATWSTVWARATSTQPTPPPQPSIDFAHEMVVVVGAGRMKPGDQIRVDSAGERSGLYNVVVSTVVGCRRFAADTYPLEVVRVARSDKQVSFIERRDQAGNCS